MRTAYDALRTAVIKDFGKWYRHEWWLISDEGKEKVQGGIAYSHFGNPFLSILHDLYIGVDVIRGRLGYGGFDLEGKLRGFKTKKATIDFYKKVKQNREDDLFYVFWFKF